MIKKTYIKLIGLSFLFILLISVIYSINVNAEIINDYNSINQNDELYVNTPNNFAGSFHNDSSIKQTFDNGSIEFMNLQNTSIVNTTYLDVPINYENSGLGSNQYNSTLITNQDSNSSGILDDNYDVINDTYVIKQENMNINVSGNYPATYSFTNDAIGTNLPDEWSYSHAMILYGGIIAEMDGHNKVMNISKVSGNNYGIKQIFSSQSNGIVDLWIYKEDKLQASGVFFMNGWTYPITAYFQTNGYITAMNDSGYINVQTYDVNTWYHLKFEIDCSIYQYNLSINGVLKAESYNFDNSYLQDSFNQIYLSSRNIYYSNTYYDAIQYSWMSYNDNRYSEPVNMINGTFDNSNNMSVNDDYYSQFNSTEFYVNDDIFISSIQMVKGTVSGLISDSYIDNENYFTLTAQWELAIEQYIVWTDYITFTSELNYEAFYVSYDIWSFSPDVEIVVNDKQWKTGTPHLDSDDEFHSNMDRIQIMAASDNPFTLRVYYFKLNRMGSPTLKFNLELNCSQYDFNDFLALNISSYHFTNISQHILGYLYNYNTLSYDLMFNNSNIVKTLNYYYDNTSIQDYFDIYGNLQIQFMGNNLTNDFRFYIDYIELIFYYNSEYTPNTYYLEYYINLDFNSYNFTSFLSLNITSYHFSNVSQDISVYIYNYNTLSYELIFESSNTVKTLHNFDNNTQVQDYLGNYGNMSFQFIGFNYDNSFQLLIDYFNVICYYNSEFAPVQYYVNETFSNTFNKLNLTVLLSELYFYYLSSISLNIELLAYNFTSNTTETLAVNSYTYLTQIFLDNMDDFINENGTYILSLYAITDEYFTFTINTFDFLIWIPTYLNHTIIFTEIGNYAYRFTIFYYDDIWNGTEYINTYCNYTQAWIYFSVIYFPTVYLGLKIAFYVYIILMIIPIVILILYTKWYANNKPKLIKSYITYIAIEILLLLLAVDSISIYLTIGSEIENSFVFTLLNALIFGVFLNVVGLNGNGIFKKLSVKGSTLFVLVITSILGFGFFGLLFHFNFPLNYIFNYDIFSTNTADGIRFFASNFLFFMLILFFSFIVESEVD